MKNLKNKRFVTAVLLPVFLFIAVVLTSCKGAAGPAGPLGDAGYVTMNFQDGMYPSNAYAGTTVNNIISGLYEYTIYYTNDNVTLGSAGGYKYRSLIKFDLSSAVVPTGVIVHKAYLTITLSGAMDNTITVYPVTAPWISNQTNWMNYANSLLWAAPGGDFGAAMDSKTANSTTLTFALNPSLVGSWISSPAANYGLILKAVDEASGAYANMYTAIYAVPSQRPKLTIYYSLP